MYYVSCDGYPLLDWRDNDLILVNPRVKLEVNTVGEGSFTIYKNHPNYDKLRTLKSVFEVRDEIGVIFRGRATGDTVDFNHGKAVDLEGAMAFFNDSVVRPFVFPDDFADDAEYTASAASGNVIEFFLKWLIDNHNSQVQEFQRLHLGKVTVTDPNNYLYRSSDGYASTWDMLKSKLFDSGLGGYLCIRYEEDGNYIDYLSEFAETNTQQIVFGENLLDIKNELSATGTYTAIIPVGAEIEYEVEEGTVEGEYVDFVNVKKVKEKLTLKSLPDGDITDDLVKIGDTLYSKSAVEEYGWIYAPVSETTWDDVTLAENLLENGVEWLTSGGILVASTIEATAVDLHFTDEQISSLRIYRNVEVYSKPHGINESYPLAKLEIDLLNPQNTKITVGKTQLTLTDRTSIDVDNIIQDFNQTTNKYFDSLVVKVVESKKAELLPDELRVFGEVDGLDITLVTVDDDNAHEYLFEFIPTETFLGLNINPAVNWVIKPHFVAGKAHQVSILRGIGVMINAS